MTKPKTMNTRRELLKMAAMSTLCGCAGPLCRRSGKFSMNASTLRGYGLTLLEQVKAVAASGLSTPYCSLIHCLTSAAEPETIGAAMLVPCM